MLRKKVKKAFTLVELLVVIAILAILATVSVVGYTQFTKRARESNDMSLTTQINTVLQAEEMTGKPKTMTEAINVMTEAGANIAELTPTTEGYSYVWNSATNRVILLDEDMNVVAPEGATIENKADCFAIIKSEADLTKWAGYSRYYTSSYTGTTATVAGDVLVGVDIGTSQIQEVSYETEAEGEAILYTNGGTVSIDAANATINHYGMANSVNIEAVAGNSYHLFGRVEEEIEISAGRVVIESGAKAEAVVLNGRNVKVAVESNATLRAIAATQVEYMNSATLPSENVAPSFVGDKTAALYFNGGFGTEAAPYEINNAEQLMNLVKLAVPATAGGSTVYVFQTPYYVELTADIYLEEVDASGYIINCFVGDFNGNGHSIYAGNDSITLFEDVGGTTTIRNLTVVQSTAETWFQIVECAGYYNWNNPNLFTLQNVTMKAKTEGTIFNIYHNASGFLSFTWMNTTFRNCTNNLNLQIGGNGYAGIFLGGYATQPSKGEISRPVNITFDTCVNNGKVVGKNIGFFTGNACDGGFNVVSKADFSDKVSGKHNAYITNCANNGTMIGLVGCTPFANNSSANNVINEALMAASSAEKASFKNNGTMKVFNATGLGLQLGEGNTVTITCDDRTGIAYFEVTYFVQMSFARADGTSAGSSYVMVTVKLRPDAISTGDAYVYAIVGSDEYEKTTGTAYAAMNQTEYVDVVGNCYKLVTTEKGMLCVVDSESMLKAFSGKADSVSLKETKTRYMVTIYDYEGYSVGVKEYKAGELEK